MTIYNNWTTEHDSNEAWKTWKAYDKTNKEHIKKSCGNTNCSDCKLTYRGEGKDTDSYSNVLPEDYKGTSGAPNYT